MNTDALLVYCTCPDDATANQLAEMLISKQLAACVNIVAGIQSVYAWQGKIEMSNETLLMIKTTETTYEDLQAAIRDKHPYELPEIVAVSITTGLPAYLEWINQSVR